MIVGHRREIQLFVGDLTKIPPEHRVDALIVSAFPNDYSATPNSLIGALARKDLSVAKLAATKEFDLRTHFSCWLSCEITPHRAGLEFRRILCFEPGLGESAPELITSIFQSLAPFTFSDPYIRSIAMPVLAAGDQGYSLATMLPPLLDASINWLQTGLPIERIKFVFRDETAAAKAGEIFKSYTQRAVGHFSSPKDKQYDVFISYSREDKDAADTLVNALQEASLRVFMDRIALKAGASWQREIFEALETCSATALLFSPAYLDSRMCKEEFDIARARHLDNERTIIFPLLVRDAKLPTYMRLLNYVDCRVSDPEKIAAAAESLAQRLNEVAWGGSRFSSES
jgi:hypothetical protein